jgi:hypothetical protein
MKSKSNWAYKFVLYITKSKFQGSSVNYLKFALTGFILECIYSQMYSVLNTEAEP